MAPPMTVASEQKATTGTPEAVPRAASIPLRSGSLISSIEPSSRKDASRSCGSRGSTWVTGWVRAAVLMSVSCSLPVRPRGRGALRSTGQGVSDAGEGDGDVVATEAEGVVERGDVPARQRAALAREIQPHVLRVVEVC